MGQLNLVSCGTQVPKYGTIQMVGFPYTQNCTCNDWYIACLIGRNVRKTVELKGRLQWKITYAYYCLDMFI